MKVKCFMLNLDWKWLGVKYIESPDEHDLNQMFQFQGNYESFQFEENIGSFNTVDEASLLLTISIFQ